VKSSDALSDFIDLTVMRFAKDHRFRVRLLAEAGETARETAQRVRREAAAAGSRRTAA